MPDPRPTFAGFPARSFDELSGVRVAVLGAAEASPYDLGVASHAADAPGAIRAASLLFSRQMGQFDYDLGATLFRGEADKALVADLGDVPTDPSDPEGNRLRITAAVRRVLAAGTVPIVLGGDDSVPIPVFAAYEGGAPMTVVQVDAHVDWGNVIRGNPYGYGSPMRRASEMAWCAGMVQVGMRGLGSGTPDQLDDARAWGTHLITAREFRHRGVDAALRHLPEGGDCLLSIDCDGIDPAVLPAVNMPTPGGLDYVELSELLLGVAAKSRIRGLNLVELVPSRDRDGLSALVASRIALTVAGLIITGER